MDMRIALLVQVLAATIAFWLGSAAAAEGWREIAPMPDPRYFHAAAMGADRKVYAYGGYVLLADGARKYGREEYSLVIYDPESDVWERGPAALKYKQRGIKRRSRGRIDEDGNKYREYYTTDRIGENHVVHELITGNASPLGRPHWLHNFAWTWFDTESGTWNHPAVPVTWVDNPEYEMGNPAKGGPSIVSEGAPHFYRYDGNITTAPGGLVYVTGGSGRPLNRIRHSRESAKLNAAEVYDAETSQWQLLAPMAHARSLHTSAVDQQGRLFVFGGHQAAPSVRQRKGESYESFKRRVSENGRKARMSLSSTEMYDPETDTWTPRAAMPTPRQAAGAALGADGRIYVIGGAKSFSDPAPLSIVEIYDPVSDRWSEGPSMRYGRRSHQVVVSPEGRIYAIGGFVAPDKRRRPVARAKVDARLGATVEVLESAPSGQ
jgi:N-acetylneuraminic acid mutarotase